MSKTGVYYDDFFNKIVTHDYSTYIQYWYDGSYIWYGKRDSSRNKRLKFIGYI